MNGTINPGSIAFYDLWPGNSGDYSGRKGRDGQKKKISKANEKRKKEVNNQGRKKAGKRVTWPHVE